MTSGKATPENRCQAKNARGEQCGRVSVNPFTPYCYFHNGWQPRVVAQAAKRAKEYEQGLLDPLDPPELRRIKLGRYYRNEQTRIRRQMKKAGILEDFDRTAEQVRRESENRSAAYRREVGEERYVAEQKYARAERDWMMSNGKDDKPKPEDFGLGPPVDADPHAEARAQGLLGGPRSRPEPEVLPGGGVIQPDVIPVPADEFDERPRAIPHPGEEFSDVRGWV